MALIYRAPFKWIKRQYYRILDIWRRRNFNPLFKLIKRQFFRILDISQRHDKTLRRLAYLCILPVCGLLFYLNSPQNIAKQFMIMIQSREYEEAMQLYVGDEQDIFFHNARGTAAILDSLAKKTTAADIDTATSSINGDAANVTLKLKHLDGETDNKNLTLIKQHGKWRVNDIVNATNGP